MTSRTWRTIAASAAAAVAVGSGAGTAGWATYRLLMSQARAARTVIGRDTSKPPEADGVYTRGCVAPESWRAGVPFDIHLMIFGDSTAAGVGCADAEQVPGVLIARGLADATGSRIRSSTKAISGATSKGLAGQVDAMFVAGPPPDVAVIMVGANDVTKKHSIARSAQRLRSAVARLREANALVVVATCPDLGTVAAIPQPLSTVVHRWSARLAHAQAGAVRSAGGITVAMGDLLGHDFRSTPEVLFSADGFHPSAAGYALAAEHILPAVLTGLGVDPPVPSMTAAQQPH
ncbi:SGNH/GDSL hydrolase family protein [Nocardia nova]|uniref:SGNH/GDSL hydrolase family protein n=1 Tax=Nocardia nova TaxID=37330 RepID=UPI00340BFAE1